MSAQLPIQFDSLEAAVLPDKPLHLAVGMFDGVHLGHQAVIETAVQSAHAYHGSSGVLTFWPHPSRLFHPEDPVDMIMSPAIKAEVLASHNIEYMIQQPFNRQFASIPAENLLAHLKERLPRLASVHVGSNWRFGKKRAGDIGMLVRDGKQLGIHVIHVERVFYDGEPISSTRIRKHLARGEMETVGALLGDLYFASSRVVPGKHLGGELGFPTLNLKWSPEAKPPFGVYCVEVEGSVGGSPVVAKGVANFGVRPTVNDSRELFLEVHVLGVCPFSTGDALKVRWYHFLRPERKFDNLDRLKEQIAVDVKAAQQYWNR